MARSVNLIYSDPGKGKTSFLASLANRVHRLTGKKTRLYTLDGGGIGHAEDYSDMDIAVAKGIVDVWYLRAPRYNEAGDRIPFYAFEVLRQACQGWWPDAEGHPQPPEPDAFENVDLCIFEGLTSNGEEVLMRTSDMRAEGVQMGGPKSVIAQFVDGKTAIAGPGQTDWMAVQNELYRQVVYTRELPCMVWWSALEGKGYYKEKQNEEGGTLEGFGPKLVGNAKTLEAVRWFGHVLNLQTALVEGELRRRIYLQNYIDPVMKLPHLACVRKPASVRLPMFIEGVDGHPNADDFYGLLEEAVKKVA